MHKTFLEYLNFVFNILEMGVLLPLLLILSYIRNVICQYPWYSDIYSNKSQLTFLSDFPRLHFCEKWMFVGYFSECLDQDIWILFLFLLSSSWISHRSWDTHANRIRGRTIVTMCPTNWQLILFSLLLYRSPILNAGASIACFHSFCVLPVSSD